MTYVTTHDCTSLGQTQSDHRRGEGDGYVSTSQGWLSKAAWTGQSMGRLSGPTRVQMSRGPWQDGTQCRRGPGGEPWPRDNNHVKGGRARLCLVWAL
jgi:hypothetical protein